MSKFRRQLMMGSMGEPVPPTPPLPYDAEVEYLLGTGTQWILLGNNVTLPTNVKVEYKAMLTSSSATRRVISFGSVSGKSNFTVWEKDNTYYSSMLGKEMSITSATTSAEHVIIQERTSASAGTFKINGGNPTNISGTFLSGTFDLVVFASQEGSNVYTGRLYYLKLWQDNVLSYDLIPVRVGTTGYLYDKVSGTLFGNAGSGSFTYGNDKN